ncbi:UDP-N-acetylmuramoyl-tripeptide--D-alanyl-D-alanine ligase [Halobacillus campisalis]|uniref:UDP-N-acetylmuramoyl-tripeptide--D-alanyl-D-alanine ligase n=1 Tax=Halobacillus campisalis TaxID=435909 RepID=A0ABW2K2F1_9BACI|nr:UDP-N-acetylmuramoyl-tripeptide--D-alanyl-D-alanine ligase [Halobacillus campisalis]
MFTINELTSIFPSYRGTADAQILIRGAMTDTRVENKQSLFVPIVGENHDAHKFINEAIKKGAVAALWQKDHELPREIPTEFPVFFVEDTLQALQETSSFYLKKVNPTVIGITGSNGKTTTKDLVASILQVKFRTHKTAGNYNNHIGLPLTILSMPSNTEVAVLEMGMSQAGEISLLSKLAEPSHVIITNIGESHIEYLGSREGIAKAKLEILNGWHDGTFIFDGDEELLNSYLGTDRSVSCGFLSQSSVVIKVHELLEDRSHFEVLAHNYTLPIAGRHNVKNAAYAISLAQTLGLTPGEIQSGFDNLELSGMRFEKVDGINGSLLINDAYNASPTSMKATIGIIEELQSRSHKILVLGDMFELGEFAGELHEDVATVISDQISSVYTIGEHANRIVESVKVKHPNIESIHFKDKESLSDHLKKKLTANTVVLIKASRGMKLEQLLNDLTEK